MSRWPSQNTRNATRFRLLKAYVVGALGYLFGLLASTLFDLPTGAIIVWAMALVGIIASSLEPAGSASHPSGH